MIVNNKSSVTIHCEIGDKKAPNFECWDLRPGETHKTTLLYEDDLLLIGVAVSADRMVNMDKDAKDDLQLHRHSILDVTNEMVELMQYAYKAQQRNVLRP